MLVIVHSILAPYRVPLFNELGQRLGGQMAVVLTRETHRKRRRWSVPWQDVSFQAGMLCTVRIAHGVFDVLFGIHRTLDRLSPEMVVLGGWDLSASWSPLRWCQRRAEPDVALVGNGAATRSFRGPVRTLTRRRFLSGCGAALVSGDAAAAFVNQPPKLHKSIRPPLKITMPFNVLKPAMHSNFLTCNDVSLN